MPEDVSWSHVFAFEKTFLGVSIQNFCHCFTCYHSHFLSDNHNPELRCVICTGVTLFALVLHLHCTALNQSESSNLFMCIIKLTNIVVGDVLFYNRYPLGEKTFKPPTQNRILVHGVFKISNKQWCPLYNGSTPLGLSLELQLPSIWECCNLGMHAIITIHLAKPESRAHGPGCSK